MKKLAYITVIGSFALGSCAAPKLAQESVDDDFYGKEYTSEESYASAEEASGDDEYAYRRSYGESDDYDDSYYSYTHRLRRFHSPLYGFGYFDYYDPFFYDPWYRPGFNLGLSFGWGGYYGYRPWGYYSYSPYYYSPYYYSTPYYGYNYAYGGGLWGGYHPGYYYSRPIYRPSNGTYSRPRPRVGSVNNGNYNRPRPTSGNVSERPSSRPRRDVSPARRPSSTERPSARPRRTERPRTERAAPRRQAPPRPQARPRPQSRPSYSPPQRSAPRSSGSSGRSGGSSRPRPR